MLFARQIIQRKRQDPVINIAQPPIMKNVRNAFFRPGIAALRRKEVALTRRREVTG